MVSRAVVISWLLVLGALACDDDSEPTQLVVLVNSDFKPVTDLARVEVAITTDHNTAEQRWDIVSRSPGKDQALIPFSFGIEPPGGDAGASVDLTVTGLDTAKHMLVRRRVRVGFVAHEFRLLEIDLMHDCADLFASCEQGGSASTPRTCAAGKCTSIDVDVHDLPQIDRGDELTGVKTLTWHCTHDCDDAGRSEPDSSDRDASPPPSGGGGMDATIDSGDGSAGTRAVSDSRGGGHAGHKPSHAGTGGSSPDPDYDGGDEDGGGRGSSCSTRPGFFADVGRSLTTTADGTLCVTVAQNRLVEEATVGKSTTTLIGLVDAALASDLDVVEFWVSQSGATLYATGRDRSASVVPPLTDILDYAPLRDSDHPVKLLVTDVLPSADEFASAVLSLLLVKQSSAAGGYANGCRPVYLMADTGPGLQALVATQAKLASDSTYAPLRGYLHFGGYVASYEAASSARQDIDDFTNAAFEFVEIESSQKSLIPAARYARAKGLQVFARETIEIGLVAPLCGIFDAVETPRHSWLPGTEYHDAITSSRTLVELDASGFATNATEVSYSVQPTGTREQRALGAATPSLASGAEGDALPGTFLSFAAGSNQSLALNNPQLSPGIKQLAILALVRFDAASVPSGGREVIVSKREGQTGWALELVDAGGGAKEVHFEAFMRNNGDSSVHGLHASLSADLFDAASSHHVLAAIDQGPWLRLRDDAASNSSGVDSDYSVVENEVPITLGSDPGVAADYFDGELQLLKVSSYAY